MCLSASVDESKRERARHEVGKEDGKLELAAPHASRDRESQNALHVIRAIAELLVLRAISGRVIIWLKSIKEQARSAIFHFARDGGLPLLCHRPPSVYTENDALSCFGQAPNGSTQSCKRAPPQPELRVVGLS